MAEVVQAKPVDARVPAHDSVRKPRKLDEVSARQVLLDLANLVFDDVGIVEEPLLRGRGVASCLQRSGEDLIGLCDALARLHEAVVKRAGSHAKRGHAVRVRDLDGVLGETFSSVDLATQRFGLVPPGRCQERRASQVVAARAIAAERGLGAHGGPCVAAFFDVRTRWSQAPFVRGQSDGRRTQHTKASMTCLRQPVSHPQIGHGSSEVTPSQLTSAMSNVELCRASTS